MQCNNGRARHGRRLESVGETGLGGALMHGRSFGEGDRLAGADVGWIEDWSGEKVVSREWAAAAGAEDRANLIARHSAQQQQQHQQQHQRQQQQQQQQHISRQMKGPPGIYAVASEGGVSRRWQL